MYETDYYSDLHGATWKRLNTEIENKRKSQFVYWFP